MPRLRANRKQSPARYTVEGRRRFGVAALVVRDYRQRKENLTPKVGIYMRPRLRAGNPYIGAERCAKAGGVNFYAARHFQDRSRHNEAAGDWDGCEDHDTTQ